MITNEQKLALEARIKELEAQLAEVTKPQEPIGYDDIFNAIAEAASPCGEGIGVSVMAFKRVIGGEIYTTPQPCPHCNNADEQTRKVIDAWQKAETRCVDLEAELAQAKSAERERCAKVCHDYAMKSSRFAKRGAACDILEAIRALGDE